MSFAISEVTAKNVLEVKISGRLDKDAYAEFVPKIEQMIDREGKIRLLVQLHDFHGWTVGALWEDCKFDMKHFNDIERLAIVGETRWQHSMSVFCKAFTTAAVEFFDPDELEIARIWSRA